MRNTIFLLVLATTIFSCDSNNEPDHVDPEPSYSVEGKWLWSPDPDDRTYSNTMLEFVDGIAYTSYADCWPELCTDADFMALDSSDRIPGIHTYTFDGNILLWDEENLDLEMEPLFECDGGIMLDGPLGKLWRLNSDCE